MNYNNLFDNIPELETDRLILRQLSDERAADYFEIFADAEVTRYYDVDTMTNIDQAKALIDRHNTHFQNRVSIRFVLELKATGKVIGSIGLYNFNGEESVEIGFDLNRRYWKQGFMTEALQRLIGFIFNDLEVSSIYAGFLENNIASENLMKRLGFRQDKVDKNIEIKPGVYETVYFYKLIC